MSKTETIRRICEFAATYAIEKFKTPLQLFAETGYSINGAVVTDKEIKAEIARNPEHISEWLSFSEDKRWTPSWGFSNNGNEYLVFHVTENGTIDNQFHFKSGIDACALMVRKEMESFIKGNN